MRDGKTFLGSWLYAGTLLAMAGACSSAGTSNDLPGYTGGAGGSGNFLSGGGTSQAGNSSTSGSAGTIQVAGTSSGGSAGSTTQPTGDPNTCEGAAALKSYVGCDYWPTVTANPVWSVFDFTAVVVNAGTEPADVTVTRGGQSVATATVAPNSVQKVYLPWVPELKGQDTTSCGSATPLSSTIGVQGGAYHLVSTRPVSVYQFSALEYQGKGGAPGKNWASCPGSQPCDDFSSPSYGATIGCFSFSNDASLLLPSTALTGNYRVSVPRSFGSSDQGGIGSFFAITGTQDGTTVTVQLSSTGATYAGAGIGAKGPGDVVTFKINQGDVLELVSPAENDLSGSQVQADKPVQVIAGNPCDVVPDENYGACDHLEQTMLPAETLGQHYVVAAATGPNGNQPGQVVRMLGNVDGTTLTYKGTPPKNAPKTLNAGQLVDLGLNAASFEVSGDHEFSVALFMPGGSVLDPNNTSAQGSEGDPSMSVSVAVEQYRTKYIFLAPDDYDINVADVIAPNGATITLDGKQITGTPAAIAGTDFSVYRLKLSAGQEGSHTLESDQPVGLQVMGYGSYTSYQYPGGANLTLIAPAPPPIIN